MKKGNYKLTISIDMEIIDKFKALCETRGLKLGKQIELLIKEKLDEEQKR